MGNHPYEDLVKSGYKQILCMNLYNQASKFMATHLKTKYRNLEIFTIIFSHFW
jgi:hypothetical protein